MPNLYLNRIIAIRSMLDSPNDYVVRQAIDLLLNLLRDNLENEDLFNEILQTAVEHSRLRPELLDHFDKAAGEHPQINKIIQEINKIPLQENISSYNSLNSIEAEVSKGTFLRWHYVLFIIILGLAILLFIILPYTYEKFLVIGATIAIFTILFYLLPHKDRTIQTNLSGIKLSYSSPSYISIGDENTINISVENSGQDDFNGAITLIFNDPNSFITPSPDQSLSVKISVPPYGREARKFMFFVLKNPPSKNLHYYFKISHSDGSQFVTSDDDLFIAPIPYLRSVRTWLLGSVGIIIILLWDQLAKLFGLK